MKSFLQSYELFLQEKISTGPHHQNANHSIGMQILFIVFF